MNINKFHTDLLAALGDNTGASDINEFRRKYVAAMTTLASGGSVAEKTQIAALTANASTAHALNPTFSDTEAEAALNALGTKINAVITALKA